MESEAMTINLTPEQEKIVKEELESGHFRTAEELISQALHTLLATAPSSSASTDNGGRHKAVREMVDFLVAQKGLTRDDAYMLTSIAGDADITEVVDRNKGVHVMLPKALFAK